MQLTINVVNNNEIKAALLRTAVRKLASQGHFDITIVREMCKLTDFALTIQMEAGLRIMHCMDWQDIEQVSLLWLVGLIEEICQK